MRLLTDGFFTGTRDLCYEPTMTARPDTSSRGGSCTAEVFSDTGCFLASRCPVSAWHVSALLPLMLTILGCSSDVGCMLDVLVIQIEGLPQAGPHQVQISTDKNDLVLSCNDISEGCHADGDPYTAELQAELDTGVRYLVLSDNTYRGRAPHRVDIVIENLGSQVEYVASFTPEPNTGGLGCESEFVYWTLMDED